MSTTTETDARPSLETLARRATDGDRDALSALVERIRHPIYRLALRMLYHPADAEDATQEILIRVVTRLGSFRHESAFSTWSHRVAANYLLTARRKRAARFQVTFELCESMIDPAPAPAADIAAAPERAALIKEMRIQCLQGLLLCLDREQRLAFVLAEVFRVSSAEGAEILEITPAAYRKRVSRARAGLHGFMRRNCGLLDPGNHCDCAAQVPAAVRGGLLKPDRLLFANHPVTDDGDQAARELVDDLDQLRLVGHLYRDQPNFAAPSTLAREIRGWGRPGEDAR